MPQVINNTTLKNAMDAFIREKVAEKAAGGLGPVGGQAAANTGAQT